MASALWPSYWGLGATRNTKALWGDHPCQETLKDCRDDFIPSWVSWVLRNPDDILDVSCNIQGTSQWLQIHAGAPSCLRSPKPRPSFPWILTCTSRHQCSCAGWPGGWTYILPAIPCPSKRFRITSMLDIESANFANSFVRKGWNFGNMLLNFQFLTLTTSTIPELDRGHSNVDQGFSTTVGNNVLFYHVNNYWYDKYIAISAKILITRLPWVCLDPKFFSALQ